MDFKKAEDPLYKELERLACAKFGKESGDTGAHLSQETEDEEDEEQRKDKFEGL